MALIIGSACSGGSDDGNGAADFASVEQRIREGAEPWVSAIRKTYQEQTSSNTDLSPADAARSVDSEAVDLADLICREIDANDGLEEKEAALSSTIDELAMAGVTALPHVLEAVGMVTWGSWPPFMLKEPVPNNDATVGPLPQALEEHIKPEFLTADKGLLLPNPGTAVYDAFQDWYQFDPEKDNRLFEIGSRTAAPLRERVSDCISEKS